MCLFLKMKSKLGWNNWIYKWGFKLPVVTVPVMTNIKYGYLYNWYAAIDSRNIANTGWHMPTDDEIFELIDYLGDYSTSGAFLKEIGTTYWDSPNSGATNSSGFNGRGAGKRTDIFSELKLNLYLWSTDESSDSPEYSGKGRRLFYNTTYASYYSAPKQSGFSIRLVADTTLLTNGQTGNYIGNDGKVYRIICIGTQEWLADNLAETKYRNGDTIPTVTDNAAWNALTTGAKCAYNNDESNVLN